MADENRSGVMSVTEPERIFPPRMVKPMEQVKPKVWPVAEPDLDELRWVVPELQKRWPLLTGDSALHWFKAAIGDRHSRFVRTKNAVGLANFDATIKDPSPVVTENFIRAKEGYSPGEIVWIHVAFAQWAKDIGAREYVLRTDSNGLGSTKEIDAALKSAFGLVTEQRMFYALRLKE